MASRPPGCPCSPASRAGRGALLGQQHVHQLVGVVRRARWSAAPAGAVAGPWWSRAAAAGFISPRPLKRVTTGLHARLLGREARRVRRRAPARRARRDLLAGVDAEQRRHGHVDVAGRHQRPEMPQEQRAQQRGDVQAVGVGVGEDADLVVAQAREVRRCRDRRRCATAMSCTSWDEPIAPGSSSQVFRILPRSGMMAWKSWSRACLAEPPAESPSTRNSSRARRVLRWCSRRACPAAPGPLTMRLRMTRCAAFRRSCALAMANCAMLLAGVRVLVQPQRRRRRLRMPSRPAPRPRASELLLGLAGELRVADLQRQHVADLVPDVLGRELHAARQQVAELAELAHRLDDAGRAGR